jgi:large subunit ribosomal protein L33
MAGKKKSEVVTVTLECTEAKAAGLPPSRYAVRKNKKKHPDKLEFKKYSKYLKRHTLHKEIK